MEEIVYFQCNDVANLLDNNLKKAKFYTGDIKPADDIIFVFGSNPEGRHGSGSARVAREQFGAVYGIGEGLQGHSYALPTKDLRVRANNALRSISPEKITESIRTLYAVARSHPDLRFMVAYRNIDEMTLNGYKGTEMIEMFTNAGPIPSNIYVSEEWHSTGLI